MKVVQQSEKSPLAYGQGYDSCTSVYPVCYEFLVLLNLRTTSSCTALCVMNVQLLGVFCNGPEVLKSHGGKSGFYTGCGIARLLGALGPRACDHLGHHS